MRDQRHVSNAAAAAVGRLLSCHLNYAADGGREREMERTEVAWLKTVLLWSASRLLAWDQWVEQRFTNGLHLGQAIRQILPIFELTFRILSDFESFMTCG